jgi:hypothetical protein
VALLLFGVVAMQFQKVHIDLDLQGPPNFRIPGR